MCVPLNLHRGDPNTGHMKFENYGDLNSKVVYNCFLCGNWSGNEAPT